MSVDYWNNTHINKYQKTDWVKKPSIFAKQIVEFLPKQGKILEIGTGQGGDANYFKSLGYRVTATDYSDKALELARNNFENIDFLQVDTSEGLPFEDESFDIVYSHMALHYFDATLTRKVFENIHRILKPNGIFATITNTIDDPEIEEGKYKVIERGYYQDPKGIKKRYFDVETFEPFVEGLFEKIILDEKGTTYKDSLTTLVRFVGKKE